MSLIARFMGPIWGPPGPTGPRWAPCWPHEPRYLGPYVIDPLLYELACCESEKCATSLAFGLPYNCVCANDNFWLWRNKNQVQVNRVHVFWKVPLLFVFDSTGGNRTMVAAATIVSMAAAKKAQQNVFTLYHSYNRTILLGFT